MATYVNDLRLKEIATGDESGTWGTSTNTNLELIAEAFSYGTEAITTNADTHTTTIADGSTDPGRSLYLKYTGTLDSACTITIGPNTVSKLWLIENGTSGSQNIIPIKSFFVSFLLFSKVLNKNLILLDEPTALLDHNSQLKVLKTIKILTNDKTKPLTAIWITHRNEELIYADAVSEMKNGTLSNWQKPSKFQYN